jgi:hypothetical protein
VVTLLKKQTGVWIDAQVWEAYRSTCSREKLRPSEPIEEFLKLILQTGSALTVSNMMQGMAKARSQGLEAYTRVLLNWYRNGKYWISLSDGDEASVETMLLKALMDVADPQLRREIQEALEKGFDEQADEKGENGKMISEEEPATKEDVSEVEGRVANKELTPEQAQKILENLREMRRKPKTDEQG